MISAAVILCSCVKEAVGGIESLTISASCFQDTKTYFSNHENGVVSWNSNDFLWVFDETGTAHKFTGPSSASTTADFTCNEWPQGREPQYALFNPKYSKALISEGLIRASFLTEQTVANPMSFSKYANISVGKIDCSDGVYTAEMKNICGLIKLRIMENGVAQVRLIGNNEENLSGVIMIDYNDGLPSYKFESAISKELVLTPRKNTAGEYLAGYYYICVPPQKFEKGLTLTITDAEGKSAALYSESPFELKRSQILNVGKIYKNTVELAEMEITSPEEIDFSRIGYHYGEDEIPSYDANIIYLEPIGNGNTPEEDQRVDRTADINDAIANVSKPGTVILKAGRYYVDEKILMNSSDVILRGETDMSALDPRNRNLTTIIGTLQDDSHPSLIVFGNMKSEPIKGEGVRITAARIPEGSLFVTVGNPQLFAIGETVLISRPDNSSWHHDLGMDKILSKDGTQTYSWSDYGHSFEINAERIITSIEGNRLYLDAPLPMSIEAKYGQGYVYHCIQSQPRVTESGVEYLNIDNIYDKSVVSANYGGKIYLNTYHADENHYWNAVRFFGAEHCWVKGVTGSHFAFSTVSVYGYSKNLTIEDCHSYDPVSLISGSRRYAFTIAKGQLCLFKGCTAEKDRHEFVTTGVYAVGPNAYVDCVGTESFSNAGPHAHWATCMLYDRVKTAELLSVEDASYLGSSSGAQGWQGANHVFWNCEAPVIVCQSPQVSARNWAWGCIGEKSWGSLGCTSNEGDRDDGEWYSHGSHVSPSSLYEYQLEQRLSSGNTIMSKIR